MLRGAVFVVTLFGLFKIGQSSELLPADEAFLASAITAVLVSRWVPPRAADGDTVPLGTSLMIVLGLYFFALKLPWLFVSPTNYRATSLICLGVCAAIASIVLWRRSRSKASMAGSNQNSEILRSRTSKTQADEKRVR